jgi:hypothetical protein
VSQQVVDGNDLEQLKQKFEEFQSIRTSRGRLPEALWKEAAEAAKRYGLNPTAHALRLDYRERLPGIIADWYADRVWLAGKDPLRRDLTDLAKCL